MAELTQRELELIRLFKDIRIGGAGITVHTFKNKDVADLLTDEELIRGLEQSDGYSLKEAYVPDEKVKAIGIAMYTFLVYFDDDGMYCNTSIYKHFAHLSSDNSWPQRAPTQVPFDKKNKKGQRLCAAAPSWGIVGIYDANGVVTSKSIDIYQGSPGYDYKGVYHKRGDEYQVSVLLKGCEKDYSDARNYIYSQDVIDYVRSRGAGLYEVTVTGFIEDLNHQLNLSKSKDGSYKYRNQADPASGYGFRQEAVINGFHASIKPYVKDPREKEGFGRSWERGASIFRAAKAQRAKQKDEVFEQTVAKPLEGLRKWDVAGEMEKAGREFDRAFGDKAQAQENQNNEPSPTSTKQMLEEVADQTTVESIQERQQEEPSLGHIASEETIARLGKNSCRHKVVMTLAGCAKKDQSFFIDAKQENYERFNEALQVLLELRENHKQFTEVCNIVKKHSFIEEYLDQVAPY